MCILEITCPRCRVGFEYICEWEDAGDGSSHTDICPDCGQRISFEIAYSPVAIEIECL